MHTFESPLGSIPHKPNPAENLDDGTPVRENTLFHNVMTTPEFNGEISLFDILLTENYKKVANDSILFVDTTDLNKKVTYGQFKDSVLKCAASLKREYNLQHGDVIATSSPDHIQYPIFFLGALAAGCVFSPMRHSDISTADDIVYDLHTLQPKLLILHPTELDTLYAAAKDLGISESNILTLDGRSKDSVYANVRTVDEVLLSSDELAEPYQYTQEDIVNSPCFLYFTSGSTGRRKAVMVSQNQLVHCLLVSSFKPDTSFKYVTTSSFSFVTSLLLYVLSPPFFGVSVYFLDPSQRSMSDICRAVEKYKISLLSLSPHMLYSLGKVPEAAHAYDLSSLKLIAVGGSTTEQSMLAASMKILGKAILNTYGMTEFFLIVSNDIDGTLAGSVGRLQSSNLARIVDQNGNDLPAGEVGELRVKGPTMTLGYYRNPQATAELFDEQGYVRTGDLCRIGENGMLYFVDRFKDLIKHKSFFFYPVEVEKVLITHPNVSDCAVVGFDTKGSEREVARAYVTLVDKSCDKDKALKEIREYTEAQLPESKHLYGGIYEVDSFPRTGSGKIQRFKLRQLANKTN